MKPAEHGSTAIYDHPLMALPKFGQGIGLHRVRRLMDAVGIDERVGERAIVVTGSNGKGSTAKIASELMRFDGGSVGLFSSPHLYRYNERFQVDGIPIADAELLSAMDETLRALEKYQASHDDAVGAFEAQLVVALKHFQSRAVRWLVLEAGIGGRYDPVRVVRSPVCGLVSLDLEHTDLLGKTLLEIAFDKLDATRRGGIAVLGESCIPFEEQIRAFAGLAEVEVAFVRPAEWRDLGYANGRQLFDIGDPEIPLGTLASRLAGRHQINNHAVAARLCCERLRRAGLWPPPDLVAAWRGAVERVAWPGRLERICEAPPVYIDVGHTPEGILASVQAYETIAPKPASILVTGGSANKNVKQMVEILAPRFDHIVCTAAHHLGLDAARVFELVKAVRPAATVTLCPTIEEAAAVAIADATRLDRAVYVAGGLFLSAEFAESCRGGDPRKLRFF